MDTILFEGLTFAASIISALLAIISLFIAKRDEKVVQQKRVDVIKEKVGQCEASVEEEIADTIRKRLEEIRAARTAQGPSEIIITGPRAPKATEPSEREEELERLFQICMDGFECSDEVGKTIEENNH